MINTNNYINMVHKPYEFTFQVYKGANEFTWTLKLDNPQLRLLIIEPPPHRATPEPLCHPEPPLPPFLYPKQQVERENFPPLLNSWIRAVTKRWRGTKRLERLVEDTRETRAGMGRLGRDMSWHGKAHRGTSMLTQIGSGVGAAVETGGESDGMIWKFDE